MTLGIPPIRFARRLVLAAGLAAGFVVSPLPISPAPIAPVRAAEEEVVPAAVREAIDHGLEFLARNQADDGSFEGMAAGRGGASTVAVPALSVLAFLARGHVPGQGPYGDKLYKSIDFVLRAQQPDGLISQHQSGNNVMYEHGIATVMLAECYGMVDDARRAKIGVALGKSADMILKAQQPNNQPKNLPYRGGWRYQVNSPDADISVTGWQMMALRGAANCGAIIPKEALEAAREYVKRSACPGGGFGYQPGQGPNQARSGTGVLILELFRGLDPDLQPGEHPKEAVAAGEWLKKNPPYDGMEFYYYGVYYCSQAANQLGGTFWEEIYSGKNKLRDNLLAQQERKTDSPLYGAFNGGNGQEQQIGPCYRTAMACLALCVPYRYLPIYQNDN